MTTRSSRSLYPIVAPVLAGILSGLVTALAISWFRGKANGATDAPPAITYEPKEAVRYDNRSAGVAASAAIADLRARVGTFEAERAMQGGAAAQPPARLEEQRARIEAAHAEAIERHRSDTVDATWAPQASTAVRTTLERLATGDGFTVSAIDCRSTSCTAAVNWQSLDLARKNYRDLLQADLGSVSCTRRILIPDTGGFAQPVQATLVLNQCRK